jgi:hypothetical protein
MAGNPAYRAKETNWRVDSLGRLLERYLTDRELNGVWAAAKRASVPEEHRNPKGSPGDGSDLPESSWFSEFILRAFEAAFGPGGDYPKVGFVPDLRDLAYNLDFAAKVLVELFSIQPTVDLIPVGWLRLRAQLKGSFEAVQRTVEAGVEYPYLTGLWVHANFSFDDYDDFGASKEIAE